MNGRFTFGTALYHPTIDIEDAAWLRNAVLFWDRIQTIVPSSIEDPYRRRDTRILAQEGILSPLAPDAHSDVLQGLEGDVIRFIENSDEDEFAGISGIHPGTAESELLHAGKLSFLLGNEVDHAFKRIHRQKWSTGWLERLPAWEPDEEGFLHVDPRFADFYMSILAAGLSKKTGSSPLSNEGRAFGANLRTIVGQVAAEDEGEHANGALVSIAMENLSIDPGVPIEQLLAFKRGHDTELEQLAIEFDDLAATIKNADSPVELQEKASRLYTKKVRPGLEKLQTRLRRESIGSAFGGVALAATLGTAATVSTAGAIALGATAFLTMSSFALTSRFALGNTKLDSPFTYLADLRRDFAIPSRLMED